jgi:protein-S-isoprenylcysteine O-methyltransferase Ste14
MNRLLALVYGIVCYIVFLVTFLYAIGFVGDFIVPKTIDSNPSGAFGSALVIDALLLGAFAIQHSVMARPAFKRWWTQFVPQAAERSTYVLFASLALMLVFWQWRPLGGDIWNVQNDSARQVLWALCAMGWAIVLVATFLIHHFDLFGLRQVTVYFRGQPYVPLAFKTPVFYRYVRHPLYLGFIIAFWATPHMSAAHLVFALATTAYILIAIQFEEHDLVESIGAPYQEYRQRVPMILPIGKKS